MPIMSIISCKIMQDEIIWILENDSSIDEIIVVENENIREFVEKLDKINLQYKILSLEKISSLKKSNSKCEKYTVLVHLMELGLHRSPKELKNKVYETIEDSYLLFLPESCSFTAYAEMYLGISKKISKIIPIHARFVFSKIRNTEL